MHGATTKITTNAFICTYYSFSLFVHNAVLEKEKWALPGNLLTIGLFVSALHNFIKMSLVLFLITSFSTYPPRP